MGNFFRLDGNKLMTIFGLIHDTFSNKQKIPLLFIDAFNFENSIYSLNSFSYVAANDSS